MDNNNNYYNGENQTTSYYDLYKQEKIKEAGGVFSRYHIALTVYVLTAYFVTFGVQLLLTVIMGSEKAADIFNNIYIQWLMGVGPMYLVGFPVFLLITKGMKKREYAKSSLKFSEFLVLFVAAKGVMFVGNLIGSYVNTILSAILGRDIANSTSDLIERSPIWLIFLVAVVIGPIIEELLFRKMMIDRLGRYGDLTAIVVSSVSFGLFHGNFHQFFYATLLGLVLGYIYTKTGKTVYNIIMHMVINFFGSIAVMPIIKASEKFSELMENIENLAEINFAEHIKSLTLLLSYNLVEYSISVAGIVITAIAIGKKQLNISKNCEFPIPRNKLFSTVVGNAGVLMFIILSTGVFALNILLV